MRRLGQAKECGKSLNRSEQRSSPNVSLHTASNSAMFRFLPVLPINVVSISLFRSSKGVLGRALSAATQQNRLRRYASDLP